MKHVKLKILAAWVVLTLSNLACEPVFVVGWQELTLVLLLAVFLVGPLIYRVVRAWIRFQDSQNKKK
jgi:hypothetical protein